MSTFTFSTLLGLVFTMSIIVNGSPVKIHQMSNDASGIDSEAFAALQSALIGKLCDLVISPSRAGVGEEGA